jgi:sugar phosphate isomerase/epimerase
MNTFPIAIQLYSVRDELEADFKGTLQKIKDFGYEGVEFAGLYGHEPDEVKAMLEEIGLVALSAHVPFVDMVADPQKVMSDYAKIGCSYIAIPYLTPEYRPGAEKFDEVIANAKVLGKAANENNLTLLYHNHDFEFEKIGDEYALDVLYQEVSADLLQTELDTCWVKVAGEDPSAYIRKYTGRAPIVHLKDFYMPGKKPSKMYELIGLDEEETEKEDAIFEFRPLGKGMQDFPAILEASKDAGAKWVVVEQDEPSMGKSPMECAQISIEYLKSL